jgi:hypothetical protein
MMEALLRRGDDIARRAQQSKIQQVAEQLKSMFGDAAIEVREAQVLVAGRGIIKRWLIDPSLRFLAGGLK